MGDTLRVPKTQSGQSSEIPPMPENTVHPLLAANAQPRKFNQFSENDAAIAGAKYSPDRSKDMARADPSLNPSLSPGFMQPQSSRLNSSLFLFNNPPRQDLILPQNYPMATLQGTAGSGSRAVFPNYYPGSRDLVSLSMQQGEKPRNDSICLPPPLVSSKHLEQDAFSAPLGPPSMTPGGHNPLRSASIFSSLIQMPSSASNSVSGLKEFGRGMVKSRAPSATNSAKDYNQDYESLHKDSIGNMFGWSSDKLSPPGSQQSLKRNTKIFENQNAFWEQMNNGMSGSIAGLNNDNINAFLANLLSGGSIDFLNMSNEQRRSSIIKFINDQGQKGGRLLQSKTPLREDIFEESKMKSNRAQGRKTSLADLNNMSPTSSLSSKASRLRDEPQSPKTSPGRVHPQTIDPADTLGVSGNPQQFMHPANLNQKQMNYYTVPPNEAYYGFPEAQMQQPPHLKRPSTSQYAMPPGPPPQQQHLGRLASNAYMQPQLLRNAYSPMFKPTPYGAPNEPMDHSKTHAMVPRPNNEKQLLPAQQYAKAEDGRPLLGATKVDQLMLVIQAREKGNTGAIPQAMDGSILGPPNMTHDKNAVIPMTVGLVGGVEKPGQSDDIGGDKKRKKTGKALQCPYCLKTFNQNTHLDVHVRSHIGYKPFECNYCLKRFTQGGNLRTHMRLHTGEKPFVCEVCNRNFSRKGNLAAHMLTHNKEKPFECRLDDCGKSFTQLGNLKSHQNKFHLPTLTKLTQTFANITGDALAQLPEEERELLDYFAKLYKNLNKGIRGRGKGKKVAKISGALLSPVEQGSPPQANLLKHSPPGPQMGYGGAGGY